MVYPHSEETLRKVAKMMAAGALLREIEAETGVVIQTVSTWKKNHARFREILAEEIETARLKVDQRLLRVAMDTADSIEKALKAVNALLDEGDFDAAKLVLEKTGALANAGKLLGIGQADEERGVTVVINTGVPTKVIEAKTS